jgi:hypothetical protein
MINSIVNEDFTCQQMYLLVLNQLILALQQNSEFPAIGVGPSTK